MSDWEKYRDQCQFPQPKTEFSSIEELTLTQEMGIRKLLARLTSSFAVPAFSEEEIATAIPAIRTSLEYYQQSSWELVPELYFNAPAQPPLVCVSSPVRLSHGEVRDVTFRTKFHSAYAPFEEMLAGIPGARNVRAKHWVHDARPSKGCVFAVHGWMLGDQKTSALTLVPGFFYRMGLDVLVVELPFHGDRRPHSYTPLSMFPSIDPACTNECFSQALFELRELALWVKSEFAVPIIPLGLSLGAQVAAVWASLETLPAVVVASPLVSLANMIWSHVAGTPLEPVLVNSGLNEAALARGFAPTCPLSYQLQTPRERVCVIAGKQDQIVPSTQAEMLLRHWNDPEVHWLDDGHIEQLVRESTSAYVHNFLVQRNLALRELLSVQRLQKAP